MELRREDVKLSTRRLLKFCAVSFTFIQCFVYYIVLNLTFFTAKPCPKSSEYVKNKCVNDFRLRIKVYYIFKAKRCVRKQVVIGRVPCPCKSHEIIKNKFCIKGFRTTVKISYERKSKNGRCHKVSKVIRREKCCRQKSRIHITKCVKGAKHRRVYWITVHKTATGCSESRKVLKVLSCGKHCKTYQLEYHRRVYGKCKAGQQATYLEVYEDRKDERKCKIVRVVIAKKSCVTPCPKKYEYTSKLCVRNFYVTYRVTYHGKKCKKVKKVVRRRACCTRKTNVIVKKCVKNARYSSIVTIKYGVKGNKCVKISEHVVKRFCSKFIFNLF